LYSITTGWGVKEVTIILKSTCPLIAQLWSVSTDGRSDSV